MSVALFTDLWFWWTGMFDIRPGRTRTGQKVALHQVHFGVPKDIQLAHCLHSLGDDAGANLPGESHYGAHEGPPVRVLVDTADQFAVELQVVRRELDDMTKARIAGPRIIDRQSHTTLQIPRQAIPEGVVVLHCFLFGEFDHQTIREFGTEVEERGIRHRRRAGVDEEHPSLGRGAKPNGGGKAGHFKSLAQAEHRRHLKPPIRWVLRGDGHPGKCLVPDNGHVSGPHYGLDDRCNPPWLAELLDHTAQANICL